MAHSESRRTPSAHVGLVTSVDLRPATAVGDHPSVAATLCPSGVSLVTWSGAPWAWRAWLTPTVDLRTLPHLPLALPWTLEVDWSLTSPFCTAETQILLLKIKVSVNIVKLLSTGRMMIW